MNQPTRLRADHLTEAFGITNPVPRLSWEPAGDSSADVLPAGGQQRLGYGPGGV